MAGDPLSKALLTRSSFDPALLSSPTDTRRVDFGRDGCTWEEAQSKLHKTRGLPLAGPPGVPRAKLMQLARQRGFNLTVCVPPALHGNVKAGGPEYWVIKDARTWERLMACMPTTESEAAAALLDYAMAQARDSRLPTIAAGWRSVWEVARVAVTLRVSHVFADAHVSAMREQIGALFSDAAPVGGYTTGACACAALWWLLCQPRALLRSAHQSIASTAFQQATDGAALPPSESSSAPGRSLGRGVSTKKVQRSLFGETMGVPGAHVGRAQVTASAWEAHHVLSCVLAAGTLRSVLAVLRTLHLALGAAGPAAARLRCSFRRSHAAAAAAWAVGLLWQACSIPYVSKEVAKMCLAELNTRAGLPAVSNPSDTLQRGGTGSSDAKAASSAAQTLGFDASGLWGTLASVASAPAWLSTLPGLPNDLQLLTWEQALRSIQRSFKARLARKHLAMLVANMRTKLYQRRGARALQAAVGLGPVLTDADREAGQIAMQRLAARYPTDPDALLSAGLGSYFSFTHAVHPGVAAAEALLHLIRSNHDLLRHFTATVDLPSLLRMLQPALPLRTQHIACCIISNFFTSGDAGMAQVWREPNRGADAHSLLPRLEALVRMEPQEQVLRYGPVAPVQALGPHPRNYEQPVLTDARWQGQGSEVSVHAAVCVWGCAGLLAGQAVSDAQRVARQASEGLHCGSPPGMVVKAACPWMAAFSLAPGDAWDSQLKSMGALLSLTCRSLRHPRHGPAAQVLGAACVALAFEPACLPGLLLLGLVDQGDPKDSESGGRHDRRKHNHAAKMCPPTDVKGATWGCAAHEQGVAGVLLDAGSPAHAESAATLISLVALAYSEAQALVTGHIQALACLRPRRTTSRSLRPSLARSLGRAVSRQLERLLSDSSTDQSSKGLSSPRSPRSPQRALSSALSQPAAEILGPGSNWTRRLLRAGAWRTLTRCLAALPTSTHLQQTVAVGLMYLAKDVSVAYSQIIAEFRARQARRHTDAAQQLRSGGNDPGSPGHEQLAAASGIPAARQASLGALPSVGSPAGSMAQLELLAGGGGGGSGAAEGQGTRPPALHIEDSNNSTTRGALTLDDANARGTGAGRVSRSPSGSGPDMTAWEDAPDLQPLYALITGELNTADLERSLQVLSQLLTSSDNHVLLFASLAVRHLAVVPELRDPLGTVGCVTGLVHGLRRWVDMDGTDQRAAERTAEWTAEALVQLLRGQHGVANVKRFAAAWKPVSKRESARQAMRGFGHTMHVAPGAKQPHAPARTRAQLLGAMMWSGLGWGGSQLPPDELHNTHLSEHLSRRHAKPAAGSGCAANSNTSSANAGSKAAGRGLDKPDPPLQPTIDEMESRSAVDPIQLMVQCVDVHSRTPSQFLHVKLPALAVIQHTAADAEYRRRMVHALVGQQLVRVSSDKTYDSSTKAAAAALWLQISETPEGADPQWWGCLVTEDQLNAAAGDERALGLLRQEAQATLSVRLIATQDSQQQSVGVRTAARLLCNGASAKAAFIKSGGVHRLVHILEKADAPLDLLSLACTALLNLSSYVPVQVELCRAALSPLLYISSAFSGLNGVKLDPRAAANAANHQRSAHTTTPTSPAAPHGAWEEAAASDAELPDDMVHHILYCAAGALWNLSRHPDNQPALARMELSLKTRAATVDALNTIVATAMAGAAHGGGKSPTGGPQGQHDDDRIATQLLLLTELLAAPIPGLAGVAPQGSARHMATYAPSLEGMNPPDELNVGWGKAPAHLRLCLDPSSDTSSLSKDAGADSGASLPQLTTLTQRLRRPVSELWPPLLVDVHNSRAQPLFRLGASADDDDDQPGPALSAQAGTTHQLVLRPTIAPTAKPKHSTRWSATVTSACYVVEDGQGAAADMPTSVVLIFDPPSQRARLSLPSPPLDECTTPAKLSNTRAHVGRAAEQGVRAAVRPKAGDPTLDPQRPPSGTPTPANAPPSSMAKQAEELLQQLARNRRLPRATPNRLATVQDAVPGMDGAVLDRQHGRPGALSPAQMGLRLEAEEDSGAGLRVHAAERRAALREFESPSVAAWAHTAGSATSRALCMKYELPSGAVINLYRQRKVRVDELLPLETAGQDHDVGGPGPSQDGLDQLSRSLLRRCRDLPFAPILPDLAVPSPPVPSTSLLPDLSSLSCLDAVLRPAEAAAAEAVAITSPRRKPWSLEDSIFAPRPQENDSKDYYDRPGLEIDVFRADWDMCSSKERFGKLVSKWAKGAAALVEVQDVLASRYDRVLRVFEFYASLGAGDPFAMQIVGWGKLMTDTDIADEHSSGCKLSDLDRIFLASNFEEDKSTVASQLNLDNALMRHEFLEALIRVAIAKFLEGKGKSRRRGKAGGGGKAGASMSGRAADTQQLTPDAPPTLPPLESLKSCKTLADACSRLLDYFLLPNCAPECALDGNTWRRERLYTEDVDLLLQERRPVLEAVFSHYSKLLTTGSQHALDIREFMELLSEGGLLTTADFNVREARLGFLRARMRTRNELSSAKAFERARTLTFLGFLEALGRVADALSPPPPDVLHQIGCTSDHPTSQYYNVVAQQQGPLPSRPSSDGMTPPTRPLDDKLEQLLELLLDNLQERFSASNTAALILRLKQGRGRNYTLGKSGM